MTQRFCSRIKWRACVEAGCVYALGVFTIGFAFGTIRVLLLVPHLGATVSVLLETPLMLAVSWKLSRWSAKKHGLLTDARGAWLMGTVAFAVLMLAELGTSVFLFGRTMREHFAGFGSVPGAIGLVAQLCFAGFPFLQTSSSRTASSD